MEKSLRLVGLSATLIFFTLDSALATPSGQACTLDLSYPKTHASVSIDADAPPAVVCSSGWVCYQEKDNAECEPESPQDIIQREVPEMYSSDRGVKTDELGHVMPDLSTENHIYDKSVAILKAKKTRNDLIKTWELNPAPGQTINDERYCYSKYRFKGLQKFERWAALYKSQYDNNIGSLKMKKAVFRNAYNALQGYWMLRKESRILEGTEATVLQSLKTAQSNRKDYNGLIRDSSKEEWETRHDIDILELKNKLTNIATAIDAYKKKHSNQNSAKLQSEKSSIEVELQTSLKYKNNPSKRQLRIWKGIAQAQKELEKQQRKLISVQSKLRPIYDKIKSKSSSFDQGWKQYLAIWRDYEMAIKDFYSPLLGDAYPSVRYGCYKTVKVSISRRVSAEPDRDTHPSSLSDLPPSTPQTPEVLSSSEKSSGKTNASPSFKCSFDGEWDSYLGNISLHQSGSSVQGVANYESRKFEGKVSGRVMTGHWSMSPTYNIHGMRGGDLILTLSDNCASYSGKWRHGTEKAGDSFYGWVKWPAKRTVSHRSAKKQAEPSARENKKSTSPRQLLEKRHQEINASHAELKKLKQQWATSMSQIKKRRAKGQDVTDLKQNLMHIRVQQQQVRKRLETLKSQLQNP